MQTRTISATFPDRTQAEAALGQLRLAGTLRHSGTLADRGSAGSATLHLMLRVEDVSAARDILRRAGGRL